MRSVHTIGFLLAAILLVLAPAAAADPANELTLALQQAEQGGLAVQSALRAMLWTEPPEAAPFILVRPTAAEDACLDEAEKRARAALAIKPDLAPALVLLGRLSWIDGLASEAAGHYQRALVFAPDYGPAMLGLADLHLDRRERDKAQVLLAMVKAGDYETVNAAGLRLAVLALWRGDGPEAVSAIAATDPPAGENGLAYLWTLAKGYALSGNPNAAAALLAREVPVWARGLWAEQDALAAQALGYEERSLTGLSRAGAALPAYPLPRWERGLTLLARRDSGGALDALSGEQTGLGGLAAGHLFLLGQAKEEAKDLPGAAKAYSDLIARRPRLGLAYYCLGRVYYRMQRYSDALRHLGTGIKVSPRLPCLYLQRAEVNDKIKMKNQAAKDRQTAAAIKAETELNGTRLRLQSMNGPNASLIALVNLSGGNQAPPRGVFLSTDGRTWRWHPWHGNPLAVPGAVVGQTIWAQPDDVDGNGALLSGLVPPPYAADNRPPIFTQPCAVAKSENGLIAYWRTDEPARAEIRIWPRGGDEARGFQTAVPEYSLWHRVALGDLFPRDYHLRVVAADAAGNTTASEIVSFRPDQYIYGLTGQAALEGGGTHVNRRQIAMSLSVDGGGLGASVRLANEDGQFSGWLPLAPIVTWVLSQGDGAKTVSVQFKRGSAVSPVYTVDVILDTRPPVIYGVLIPAVDESGARLTWRTDEATECRVDMQQGQSWFTVHVGPDPAESHAATIAGLQAGTKYYLRITATDRAGNGQTAFLDLSTITTPDRTPPTGRLFINGGARFTRSIHVSLTVEGYDAESGLRDMSFSNDGVVWMPPEAFTPTKTWRLIPGDGLKTVYLRLTDQAGNTSAVSTAQITLDTTPPGIFGLTDQVLTDGRLVITWRTDEMTYGLIQLGLSPFGFSEPNLQELTSSVLAGGHTATLPPPGREGLVYYRAVACDQAGNISYGSVGSLLIPERDQTRPTGGITINQGDDYARSAQVQLTLWARDNTGVTSMQLRNAGQLWGPWEAFATNRYWTLAPGDGEKEVQVRFRDGAGNESLVYSDRIHLDTRPPSLRDLSVTQTGPYTVTVRWRTDEPANGVIHYRRVYGGLEYRQSEGREANPIYDHQIVLGNLEPGVEYRARLVAADRAGNETTSSEFALLVPNQDRTPPSGRIEINNGAAYTRDRQVTLNLAATDPGGTVASMSFSNDGRTWTPDEPYRTSRTYLLPAGDGQKTVHARFRDQAGNYSSPVSDSIILDTGSPAISNVSVRIIDKWTVEITWRTSEPAWCELRYGKESRNHPTQVKERGSQQGGDYLTEHRVVLERLAPGLRYYFVITAYDQAGNSAVSPEGHFDLKDVGPGGDQTPPSGRIDINNGAAYTRDRQVTLNLTATDPGGTVASMSFSNDGRNWTPDEPYRTSRTYLLPAGDGQKTVHARFRDQAGNYSAPVSDSIVLDTSSPTVSNVSVKVIDKRTVEITWRTSEPSWCEIKYGRDSKNHNFQAQEKGSWENGQFTLEHRIVLQDLVPGWDYYFVIIAYDRAGNSAASPEGHFDLKGNDDGPGGPPVGPGGGAGINVALASNGGRASENRPNLLPGSGGGQPGAAIDGNAKTYWSFKQTSTAVLPSAPGVVWQVEFKDARQLSRLILQASIAGELTIEYRQGGRWVTAQRVTRDNLASFLKSTRDGVSNLEFNLNVRADAIRLTWRNVPKGAEIRLYEVEALAQQQ